MNNTALYILTVLVWGSTWLMIEYQLGVVDPAVSVVWRYALAVSLLFGWCLAAGKPMRFPLHAHLRFLGLGALLFSFNYIATYTAQAYISSALNAVAFSTMMWLNVINSRLFFRTRIEPRMWFGVLLGSAGILALFWPDVAKFSWSDQTLIGAGFSLGGAMLASLGNLLSKRAQESGLPILQSNAWGMLYGTLITATVAWRLGLDFDFEWTASYIVSLAYLVIFGTIVAFGAYLKLVGNLGPHKAGYVVVMFPVVAVVLSVVFEGTKLTPGHAAGIGLVLLGNAAILGGTFQRRALQARLARWRHEWLDRKVVVSRECSPPGWQG